MSAELQAVVPGPLERLRQASSQFLNRAMFAAQAGITFLGKRDLYEALGYKRTLRPVDYRSRYARGGIAARVVEAIPKATWRGGVEILEDEDPENETEFETAVKDLGKRLRLWNTLSKADILSGLGQFSILLIGAPGDLREPLEGRFTADDIYYIQPYSQEDVLVQMVDVDPASPRFGLPTEYQIRRLAGAAFFGISVGSKLVHHSRVVHIADNRLDDRIFGHPLLERCWNDLDNLDKVIGGGSEAFWKRADQGIIFNVDPTAQIDSAEASKMKEAADEYINGYRRVLATRGMTAQVQGSDVANMGPNVDSVLTVIAGATGIPKRILIGSERGELASTQDRENWEQRISDRRSDYAEPEIVRPLIQKFIDLGILPEPEEFIIRWPDIEYLNETEQADIATKWAGLNKAAGAVVVLPQEIRDRVLRLDKLEDGDLPETDSPFAPPELAPAPDPMALLPGAAVDPETGAALPAKPTFGAQPPQLKAAAAYHVKTPSAKAVKLAMKKKLRGTARYHARKALKTAKRAVNRAAVKTAHGRGAHDVMLAMVAPLAMMKAGLHKIRPSVAEAHHRTRKLTRLGSGKTFRVSAALEQLRSAVQISDKSLQYAAQKAVAAITDIDEKTRASIAASVDKAYEKGWTADRLATHLENIVPLNDVQIGALENLRSKLEDGEPGDIVSFGDRSARIPSDGGSDDWIDKQVGVYSDDLLSDRAELIANTALDQAIADGQRDEWSQMLADGELDENTLRRWVASQTACPDCSELDGSVAGLDEEYEDGVDGPLLHPDCDCDEELFVPKEA